MTGPSPRGVQRRELLLAGAGLALGLAQVASPHRAVAATAPGTIKAIAFDMFTIFDPRGIDAAAEKAFAGKGSQFALAWRARIFDYCWLRTLTGNYVDLEQVLAESLDVTVQAMKLDCPTDARDALLGTFFSFKPYPDSVAALTQMHDAGLRLAPLAVMTDKMLRTLCDGAGIGGLFEDFLSTDRVRAYKPDPRSYAMAEAAFKLPREAVAFSAFGYWDAAGAKSFGLKTFWVNRFGVPADRLGAVPDATGSTLFDLQKFVTA